VKQEKRFVLIILGLSLAFAAYLRFFNLGTPSFWVDELDFVVAAQSQARVGEPLLASGYVYPRAPILTYALTASYSIFGVSEFSSRLPSAIFGWLSVLVVFFIGKRWFNARIGLIAAIFMAIAPFEVGWSRVCRMYALFQLLFLLAMFFLYQGFEKSPEHGRHWLVAPWELHWPSLLAGFLFLLLSYTTHQNAALFVVTFSTYLASMAFLTAFNGNWSSWLRNKYTALTLVAVSGLVIALAVPAVRDFLAYAVGYQPKWAEVASAQNRWRIFEFFMNRSHFPINVLCLVGAFMVSWKRHQAGFYALLNLLVPVVFFSFVFQYRKNDYIYHVYPVLFLLAALPVERIMTFLQERLAAKTLKLERFKEYAFLAAALFWIPFTPGFRLSQKIPRMADGQFNGAIYHNEWKAATQYVGSRLVAQDLLISTLPLSVLHYMGRVDYNLNWSNAALAKERNILAPDGRVVDFYSGADIIDTLNELKRVLSLHRQGWLLLDNYRFNNPVYVPATVNAFLREETRKAYETANGTISVFRWHDRNSQAATN